MWKRHSLSKNRKGNNKRMFLLESKQTLCYSWGIFQKIPGATEKKDAGLVKSIRMGGIRLLKENCSQITVINVRQHFEKV